MNFLLPLSALLAGCTLYERVFGAEIAHAHIYDALWFHTLWGIVLVYACMECIRRKIWKRPLIALLHAAFVLIAVGYAFTCYHATSGKLHLRSGVTATHYFTDDLRVKVLPLPLTLKEVVFTSSEHPEAYSIISCNQIEEEKLGVNSVLEINHHRFYQSALDRDGKGVNLTIIHAPIGRWLSHAAPGAIIGNGTPRRCGHSSRYYYIVFLFTAILKEDLKPLGSITSLCLLPIYQC